MFDQVIDYISQLETPGYFITAGCSKEANKMPGGLRNFIYDKLSLINQGLKTRKFIYQEDGWRIILTFFPTTEVVEERYALKNEVYKRR